MKQAKKQAPAAVALGAVTVRRIPVSKIRRAAYNPRKELWPGEPEYEQLRRSIEAFGVVDPLVWNKRSGNLVGGHQRLNVLIHEFGAKDVDVSVVDLDPAQERALNVALNKITGEWDDERLAALLETLREDPGIDATLTGFDDRAIDLLLERQREQLEDEPDTGAKLAGKEYKIVIDCTGEAHQRQLLERFNREKLTCRALIS